MRDRGFTLLEVLVAFVIAALALAMLFSGALGALAALNGGTSYETALAHARSRLALESVALVPGQRSGQDREGYRWQVRVRPVQSVHMSGEEEGGGVSIVLYDVALDMAWGSAGHGHSLSLTTQRLATQQARGQS